MGFLYIHRLFCLLTMYIKIPTLHNLKDNNSLNSTGKYQSKVSHSPNIKIFFTLQFLFGKQRHFCMHSKYISLTYIHSYLWNDILFFRQSCCDLVWCSGTKISQSGYIHIIRNLVSLALVMLKNPI